MARRPTTLVLMVREQKKREREHERQRKASTYYAVFPHAIDNRPTGRGYVTRPVDESGKPHDHRNYGSVRPASRTFKRRADAERAADKLGR